MVLIKFTVIIPVYNAAQYVAQAVESALSQPETAEVILVEDGSLDGSLAVCEGLAAQHDKVRLLRHPDGENRGAAASRNLGMKNAFYDFIAFLDADDYYLPGRFSVAREIFASDPECDGVYEAMGVQFESEAARRCWFNSPRQNFELTTITEIVPPENLFELLIRGGAGHFSICGLVIKKAVLGKMGYMNSSLGLHQDTEFIFRLSAVSRLLPGVLNQPVVVRRVHEGNRITAPRTELEIFNDHMKMWFATYEWLKKKGDERRTKMLLNKLIGYYINNKRLPYGWKRNLPNGLCKLIRWSLFGLNYPQFVFTAGYWKRLILGIWRVPKQNSTYNP
jgi:glycosyltransferase involved in cell wall biosynthesis